MEGKVKITLDTLNFSDIKPPKKKTTISAPHQSIQPAAAPEYNEVMASYSGKVFNALARANTKDAAEINNKLVMQREEVIFIIQKTINTIPVVIGINAHKLLKFSMEAFIRANPDLRKKGNTQIQYEVAIPFRQFCRDIGYNIDPDPAAPDQEAEKKRAQQRLRGARREVTQLLDRLHNLSATWKEKTRRGKGLAKANEQNAEDKDFRNYAFIGSHGIEQDLIKITLDPTFINDYIVALMLPQTKYNRRLAEVRDNIAYVLGDMLYQHYVLPKNIIANTNDILKIETILKGLPLPTYEELEGIKDPTTGKRTGGTDPRRWRERIKDRLEDALNTLHKKGILAFWGYCGKKKRELPDEEAQTELYYYERWKEYYLNFSFTGQHTIDLVDEYKKLAEEKAAKEAKKGKRAAKTKNNDQ